MLRFITAMRLLDFAVPVAGSLCLMGSSSLFSEAVAHPNHRAWETRRAVIAKAPMLPDYDLEDWDDEDDDGGYGGLPQPLADNQLQSQRRCNMGRLLGGLAGGGLGYAASRESGRSWAVPLGALLGSQVGCPMALGQGPLGGLGF
ncbi:MAG: hypothetical protein CBD15_006165 [Synechococcus sp. TMED155]|nr:MAG: hypothetical protein CBD15_006165 [Synechococcus sp. TMED155]